MLSVRHMPVAAPSERALSLRELWAGTLQRVNQRDVRSSVRPHELRLSSDDGSGLDPTPPGQYIQMPSPSEAGLQDLDGLRSGRERYLLGEMLGRGGMSVVLQAVQRSLGRSVAVKVARFDLDQRQRERFRAESKLTAWLEHPNITPVYEAGRNYLVMRRITGCDLERQVESGRLGLQRIIEVLIKVCDAVSFAHHRGIIHRDIKPDNILVGDFGEVMLIDWGLALTCVVQPDGVLRAPAIVSGPGLCAGTPGYMAPEMAVADITGIGPATDVFLLGATLYRCLGGGIPFAAPDVWQALEGSAANRWRPIDPSQAPQRLIALQTRAMALCPGDRPSVADFQTGLREWLMQSRSEADAHRALEEARVRCAAARSHRLQPQATYHDFVGCIAACDRALALNPDLVEAEGLREQAIAEFALAAVGAGEMQLARHLKDGGRLPALRSHGGTGAVEEDASMVSRIGRLLPGGSGQSTTSLLRELVLRQREIERLASDNARLRVSYDAVASDRDNLAVSLERRRVHRRSRLRQLAWILAASVLVWLLLAVA
jgi:predicted Ser/Thr protein kinase